MSTLRQFIGLSFVLALLFYVTVGSAGATSDITTGLLAYYPFSGNANDASGGDNNGAVNNAILTSDRFGNPNSAYNFNGVDSFIGILKLQDQSILTVSLWFNTEDTSIAKDQTIYGANNQSYASRALYIRNSKLLINNPSYQYTGVTVHKNTWTHAVVVYSAIDTQLYINGNIIWSVPLPPNRMNEPNWRIGSDIENGSVSPFKGSIDEVRVYNRVLTASDVTALYTSTAPPVVNNTTKSKTYLGAGDDYLNISTSGTTVYGNSGNDTITITDGITNITLDQNVERINLTRSVDSYTFKQTGNKINAYDATGAALLVTVPVQGDKDGTVFGFSDGSASALLANGIMTLGGATVSPTAPGKLTPILHQ